MGERQLLKTLTQFAGKPATYKRNEPGTSVPGNYDIVVVPLENVLERITFQINGFNMSRGSCIFLMAMPPCGEPIEGDVIAFLIGETVEEYEVCKDGDGVLTEPFGMNQVGMIVHTKKRGKGRWTGLGTRG